MFFDRKLVGWQFGLLVVVLAVTLILWIPKGAMAAEAPKIEVSGTLEVEASNYSRDFDSGAQSEKANDVVLATVEIGIDAEINPSIQGHVLLLWEEGESEDINDFMDEGTITVSNPDKCPFYLTAGKMYLPFGVFESAFVSDPMTLEIGEINDSAIQIGYQKGNADLSFGFFNGDVQKTEDINNNEMNINSYFANLTLSYEQDPYSMALTVSYISNLADTDGLEGAIDPNATIDDYVNGLGVSFTANMGSWFLNAEYLAAMDEFELGTFYGWSTTNNVRLQPSAYNIELGWETPRKAVLALKYEQADDTEINDDFDLPETRYGVALSYTLYEDVDLSFEYLHEAYDNANLNKGDSDIITAQLAVGF